MPFEPGGAGSLELVRSAQSFLLDSQGRLRAELHSPSVEAIADVVIALGYESAPWYSLEC